MSCAVWPGKPSRLTERVSERIRSALRKDEQALVDFFGHNVYSLRHLFKDEQRRILNRIISEDVTSVTDTLRKTVRDYSEVLSFLAALSMPVPDAFRSAAEVVLNDDLLKALESLPLDLVFLERRVADAETWGISLDLSSLLHTATRRLEEFLARLGDEPENRAVLGEFHALLSFLARRKWDVNLWEVQNRLAKILAGNRELSPEISELIPEQRCSSQPSSGASIFRLTLPEEQRVIPELRRGIAGLRRRFSPKPQARGASRSS